MSEEQKFPVGDVRNLKKIRTFNHAGLVIVHRRGECPFLHKTVDSYVYEPEDENKILHVDLIGDGSRTAALQNLGGAIFAQEHPKVDVTQLLMQAAVGRLKPHKRKLLDRYKELTSVRH